MAEATLTPAEPFYRLPTCTDLAQVEAAALILGAPVATLYESVGDYASLIGNLIPRRRAWAPRGGYIERRAEVDEGLGRQADAQFTISGDIDQLFESLRSRNINILQPPKDQPWGCRDFVISDPDGNKVWISSPVSVASGG